MDPDNGILAEIPGDFVARGGDQLPPAGSDQQHEPARQVQLLVPGVGEVCITYRLSTYRHGKSRRWHWIAFRAEKN